MSSNSLYSSIKLMLSFLILSIVFRTSFSLALRSLMLLFSASALALASSLLFVALARDPLVGGGELGIPSLKCAAASTPFVSLVLSLSLPVGDECEPVTAPLVSLLVHLVSLLVHLVFLLVHLVFLLVHLVFLLAPLVSLLALLILLAFCTSSSLPSLSFSSFFFSFPFPLSSFFSFPFHFPPSALSCSFLLLLLLLLSVFPSPGMQSVPSFSVLALLRTLSFLCSLNARSSLPSLACLLWTAFTSFFWSAPLRCSLALPCSLACLCFLPSAVRFALSSSSGSSSFLPLLSF